MFTITATLFPTNINPWLAEFSFAQRSAIVAVARTETFGYYKDLTLLLPGCQTNDYSRGWVFRTPKLFLANFDHFLDSWNHYRVIDN